MTIGGDPAQLERLAAAGAGHAFALDRVTRLLERASAWHRATTPMTLVDATSSIAGLRRLVDELVLLEGWVRRVAAALRAADGPLLGQHLLALGSHHPAATHDPAVPPTSGLVRALPMDDLAALAGIPGLPGGWRDRIHRERARRWVDRLDERIAAVPPDDLGRGPLDLLTRWVDTHVVDRLSPVVDLHVTRDEVVARLQAEADGVRLVLARPDVTIWSFDHAPDGRPTVRLAFGDPTAASHLALLLPGTGSGLHTVRDHLGDAGALHRHAHAARPDGVTVATVLDLYAAPSDLGAAADPAPGHRAGVATAAFLADLPAAPTTTLVGHSYGALVAARASDGHQVADLVLLGAPGVGVTTRAGLQGARRVWAARARGDPIGLVADLDEHLQRLPPAWRPRDGPLAAPTVAHGPDPSDPEFGARHLPTDASGPGVAGPVGRGHLQYLRPGSTSLANVARVVVGQPPA